MWVFCRELPIHGKKEEKKKEKEKRLSHFVIAHWRVAIATYFHLPDWIACSSSWFIRHLVESDFHFLFWPA